MKHIDTTRPISDEDQAYLRARLPKGQVDHMVALAAGADFEEEETEADDEVMKAGDNPDDFTVDEVVEFLSKPDTTDEERERILKAEREGKAREGIVG